MKLTLVIFMVTAFFLAVVPAAPHIDERADHPDAKRNDITDIYPVHPQLPSSPSAPPPAQCLYGNWVGSNCQCASGCVSYRGICDDPFGRCNGAAKAATNALTGLVVVAAAAVGLL